jgi:Holliday junction DNA helicase RuvA
MLESLSGTVESIDETGFVLRIGPVCVRLLASRHLLSGLVQGRFEEFAVEPVLQIDGSRLNVSCIAFVDPVERDLYTALVTVPGVGPRAAVRAMARPAPEIASAVAAGDETFLSRLPGIGKARARQIVAALQEKLVSSLPGAASGGRPVSEARAMLAQLGLGSAEIESLLERAVRGAGESAGPEELFREAMRIRGSR